MNKVILIGNITKDLELRATSSGNNVCSFTVAVNDKLGKDEQTNFINCVAWNQQAKFLTDYAKKGMKVSVEGRLSTRTYDRKDGTKAQVTEVICERVELLTPKKEDSKEEYTVPAAEDESLSYEDDDLPF